MIDDEWQEVKPLIGEEEITKPEENSEAEYLDQSSFEIQENKRLAALFDDIAKKYAPSNHSRYYGLKFADKISKDWAQGVNIDVISDINSRNADKSIVGILPPEVQLPLYWIDIFITPRLERNAIYTSPRGNLSSYVLGTDNRIYALDNRYVLNNQGQLLKIESFSDLSEDDSLEDVLKEKNLKIEEVTKIDFNPRDLGLKTYDNISHRSTKPDHGDYEKLFSAAQQIKNGQLLFKGSD